MKGRLTASMLTPSYVAEWQRKGMNVNMLYVLEYPALLSAIGSFNLQVVEALLEAKADPNIQFTYPTTYHDEDHKEETPLEASLNLQPLMLWQTLNREQIVHRLLMVANPWIGNSHRDVNRLQFYRQRLTSCQIEPDQNSLSNFVYALEKGQAISLLNTRIVKRATGRPLFEASLLRCLLQFSTSHLGRKKKNAVGHL
jgi:hypothetical protein